MARVTVEDCIEKISNRFELVMVAAQRGRKIGSGAPLTVDRDNDKNPVVALREIAAETVNLDDLKEELVRTHQRMIAFDDEEAEIDLMDGEKEWNQMADQAAASERALYGDENIDDEDDDFEADDDEDPSLEDLAGEKD